ncbi:MAG TPA: hypothetical protein VJU61_22370, partial [Polyangiaceae bacterium]|nr:hypothetical protein [Polyangiaceae bacterium]
MKQWTVRAQTARDEYSSSALLSAGLLLASACGGMATSETVSDRLGGDFVSVSKALSADTARSLERARRVTGGVTSLPDAESSFYVAIRKELLGTRWFLSGFMKQFYPDNRPLVRGALELPTDQLFANSPLGTRVVSFEIQNDRLFLFDASDRFQQSELQDPALLIEAYPIVEDEAFSAL